ncbi:uncharacterized protein KY384_003081 [Bacidia gigantensis]|uniref:uncharacterized protein n=1 Tax=Bacidia gigantensis TaxID=2732470 RepID=UPI001D0495CF|nr:uncharacterized protein KY384_003081 [Bacidia gigantensis]KAG8531452.1 hypothetical protein KY384_003081 [Bacidia gigantensis]
MVLRLPIPRYHLLEIDDQQWFPSSFRYYIQSLLTDFWTFRLPFIQPSPPASLVAKTLRSKLGGNLYNYTYVDFCAGAGGPTPYIEQEVNGLVNRKRASADKESSPSNGAALTSNMQYQGVDFIMTDLHPYIQAWRTASEASESSRLAYVPVSVDASRASKEVLQLAEPRRSSRRGQDASAQNVFRLFSLAFHHFDDALATKILRNTINTSDGFAIFELQGRDAGNILTVLLLWPMLLLGSWWWFWGQWDQLFWTYVIPVVPFVIVYDGLISCLRTRREEEIFALLKKASEHVDGGLEGWNFEAGEETHTWPIGTMSYFVGIKK